MISIDADLNLSPDLLFRSLQKDTHLLKSPLAVGVVVIRRVADGRYTEFDKIVGFVCFIKFAFEHIRHLGRRSSLPCGIAHTDAWRLELRKGLDRPDCKSVR